MLSIFCFILVIYIILDLELLSPLYFLEINLIPQMYSKDTDTHQYLNPSSCHSPHITKNLPKSVINRIRRNCLNRIDDDKIFKDTMIDYKAYLMKSGYEEKLIDEKFSSHVVTTKTKDLLRNKKRTKQQNEITKCRMVTDYEPTFLDIRKAFRKFKHIIEDDEELKEIFPKGVSHFQVSKRRGSKNIKELLTPSMTRFREIDEDNDMENGDDQNMEEGCYPCGKLCAYCHLLEKSQGKTFKSKSNKKVFKICRRITCKSRNIIYFVTSAKCKLQGVGQYPIWEKNFKLF